MQNIVIVGAGAMGCYFAARLGEAGMQVTLVDVDPDRLALLSREGIKVSDDQGDRTIAACAMLAVDVAAPADLVMLFTKGIHSAAAARSVAHLADGSCYALTLQNGIGNAEILADVFAPDRVLMGVTDIPADLTGANSVASHGLGHIRLGGMTAAGGAAAGQIAMMLNDAGLNAEAETRIEVAIWEKVAFNAALNALATVSGATVGGMDHPAGRRIIGAVVAEVIAAAGALNIPIDSAQVWAKINFALANHRGHKASMLQDMLAGRTTEIESINGAIVRAADGAGVATPVTATLADIVRLMQDQS